MAKDKSVNQESEEKPSGILAFFRNDKGSKIIVALGIAGILFIFLSSMFSKQKEEIPSQPAANTISSDEYVLELENKLNDILGRIAGVGSSKVMVTLENGIEYIYAQEEKSSGSKSEDATVSGGSKLQQSEDTEKNYLLVDGSDGKQALVVTEVQPKIKGVVIVCSGGNDPVVKQRILDAVTTALDITTARVCVTQLS